MMGALYGGGMTIAFDERRDELIRRHSDRYYRAQPKSLYELGPEDMSAPDFPRRFDEMAVKILHGVLGNLMPGLRYWIIWMNRDFEEVRQSYEGFFPGRLMMPNPARFRDRKADQQISMTREFYEALVARAKALVRNRRDVEQLVEVQYADVMTNPYREFKRLADLGWPINPFLACCTIKPSAYRFRLPLLVEGL